MRIKSLVIAVLLVGVFFFTNLSPSFASHEPKALVVLIEFDPWRMVLGSDSPTFAHYDDGTVIFIRNNMNGNPEYASIQLDPNDFEELHDSLRIGSSFYALEPYYDLLLPTDQPNNFIYAWDEERGMKAVGVYGDLRSDSEARSLAPHTFLRIFDQLVSYQHPDAQTWYPDQFEVLVWPHERSDAVPWPEDWPDLNHPTTVQRNNLYSIYLPIEELEAFRELSEDASAFRINGQSFTFSVRYPLPDESSWMGS
jgi:hypothetical protein